MAKKHGRVRRFFPGGNTAYGFYSFYDQIIAPDATRIFIIKGGPGVGKSTFIRRIGEEMVGRGFATELLQCSSDNDSLDGVVLPEIDVALIDGTAPHIVDPRHPGCVDEIVNLGEYWNKEGMTAGKEAVLATNREVGRLFTRAYRFLRAAKEIRDAQVALSAERFRVGAANILADRSIVRYLDGRTVADRPGKVRRLFASALTPGGPRNYLSTIFDKVRELVVLTGRPGTGKSTLLVKFARAATEKGLAVECFHCGFDPARLEHLYLPEMGLGFVTSGDYHPYGEGRAMETLDLNECLEAAGVGAEAGADDDRSLFIDLLGRATTCLKGAKETHDEMEQYYIPNMDFAAIDKLRERILQRILGYTRAAAQVDLPSAGGL